MSGDLRASKKIPGITNYVYTNGNCLTWAFQVLSLSSYLELFLG